MLPAAACVDEFQGSNILVDFGPSMPVQASPYLAGPGPGELPSNVHFTLYAVDGGVDAQGAPIGRLFELERFEIHRVLDARSPCFIDVGDNVPFPGLHVSQFAAKFASATGVYDLAAPPAGTPEDVLIDVATAQQRMVRVAAFGGAGGHKAVTSVSTRSYGPVAADCSDTSGIPPATCTDGASNRRRLAACQAEWRADPAYYEGTDRVLTAPLNGTTYGFVVGMNPINLSPVGGAQLFVDEVLIGFQGYAVYWQYDDADGDGAPDYPDTVPMADRTPLGQQLLYGEPEERMVTRGVQKVRLRSLTNAGLTAEMAIFADLDNDDVQF